MQISSHYAYDMPENYYFGGGSDSSVITPMACLGLVAAVVLILVLPRRRLIIPVFAGCLLLPFGTSLVAAGLHFPALRIILAAGWIRFVVGRDLTLPPMNRVDDAFLLWAMSNAVAFSILWGGMGAVTNRLGFLWNTLGAYFLGRMLIRDKRDVVFSIKLLAMLIIIIAPAMAIEHLTQHNLFSMLGAPALSDIRAGSIRAKGPFGHAIIAGTIGAMLMPLFVGLWWQGNRNRLLLGLGILGAASMTITSGSSTPVMTLGIGALGLLLWPSRKHLKMLRRGLALALLSLHLAMKAPVWMLIGRTGGAIGGSGYHRAMLIDNFIGHFREWWLLGTRTNGLWGYDMWDVDNAFVAAGVGGGLITLVAFVGVLVYAYKQLGKSMGWSRTSRRDQRLIWAIGACVCANTVGFFGIVYFDQSVIVWYSVLAMVSATASFSAAVTPYSGKVGVSKVKSEEADLWDGSAVDAVRL
jgi:hypothetical protein